MNTNFYKSVKRIHMYSHEISDKIFDFTWIHLTSLIFIKLTKFHKFVWIQDLKKTNTENFIKITKKSVKCIHLKSEVKLQPPNFFTLRDPLPSFSLKKISNQKSLLMNRYNSAKISKVPNDDFFGLSTKTKNQTLHTKKIR